MPGRCYYRINMRKTLVCTAFLLLKFTITFGQYKNLAMEGAGIRGIAYTGALKLLEERHMLDSVQRVAGTSVGSMVAVLLGVGYSADELKEIMFDLKIQTFNDGSGFFIGGEKRLRKNFGWYKGEELEKWTGNLIKEKTGTGDLTFLQLHELSLQTKKCKDVFITATNLSKQRAEVFSWLTNPDMKIRTAVRVSVSVPLYFTAVLIDENGKILKKPDASKSYNVYVDGGVLCNYPLRIFDDSLFLKADSIYGHNEHPATLGLKMERPDQIEFFNTGEGIAPYHIANINEYVAALYNVIMENLNRKEKFESEKKRTIYISTKDLGARVRKIETGDKQKLYDCGYQAARNFLAE
jgi:NTE family protein